MVLLLLAACGGGGLDGGGLAAPVPCSTPLAAGLAAAPDAGDDTLQIVNDSAALSAQVNCLEQPVPITAAGRQKAGGNGDPGVRLTLVAEVSSPAVVGRPEFLGGTLDDLSAGGAFVGQGTRVFTVEIDGTGAVDTFRWSDDGGQTWMGGLTAIDGAAQPLADGVTVAFGALTGHAVGDAWRIEAGVLQAASVDIKGDSIIVGYNTAGAPRLGGIQVFHMQHGFPVLTSQALFRDADIHAVSASGGSDQGTAVYAAGAARKDDGAAPAMLERIRLVGQHMVLDGHARMGLPSFATTGVTAVHAGVLYAASGNTGGLAVIDDAAFSVIDYLPMGDARWLAGGTHTLGLLAGGAPGQGGALVMFDVGNQGGALARNSFAVAGADVPEAKNTVELAGDTAVVAAGPAGVQVLDLADGALLAELPVPTGVTADPLDSVANAATVDNDVMFVSFGGAGIYAARADRHFTKPGGGAITVDLLGRLDFGDRASANHVAYKADYLYVAAGLGGLKIVRVACDPR
ncbi:MAG: hypothetical protein HZA24_12090 [Nitrospirae bacterium]|nr:hypothetical protein [Nitrospirota bacterium]